MVKKEIELFLNSIHDSVIAIDRNAIITIFNKAAEELTKIKAKDAINKKISDVIKTTRLPLVLKTGKSELNQLQLLLDTEIITNRKPVYNDEGEIIGAIAVFRNVGEVKELIEKITNLRSIQNTLKAIIESTQDAISVVDENGYGMMINRAYTRLTGYTTDDIIGLYCTKDLASGESVHLEVLKTRKSVSGAKLRVGPQKKEVIVEAAPIMVNGELKGSVAVIHDVTEINRLISELDQAKSIIRSLEAKYTFDDIIGKDTEFMKIIKKAKATATTPATIMLRGESGVGKELFAHAIHNKSRRKNNQFIRVNCAALSDSLLESELFGYEPGAFTGANKNGKIGLFEKAHHGTIFLDEIGEIKKSTQVKLLRVVQEREIIRVGGTKAAEVDVRIISATNKNLEQEVKNGNFRKDLYYRLNVVPINIIPLREHIEDMDLIVHKLIIKYNQEYGRNVQTVSSKAIEKLKRYDWPGNVRELENFIGRMMININLQDEIIELRHLPLLVTATNEFYEKEIIERNIDNKKYDSLKNASNEFEKKYIIWRLKENNNNRIMTAKELQISERSLYYKISKYRINS
ncbi:MAG: sigma 54-interacting transcriptional regulator [Bacillota bacterium]|nr:sigma 54-interacting transcriptional regulator [Bacillota bacterium]